MNIQSKHINRTGKIGWEKHMAAWQSSGLTQAVYCRQHDLNPRYFSVWKNKLLAFDGLSAIVHDVLNLNPLEGQLFVFRNKSGDKIKLLMWNRNGFVQNYKRLQKVVLNSRFEPANAIQLQHGNWNCYWMALT